MSDMIPTEQTVYLGTWGEIGKAQADALMIETLAYFDTEDAILAERNRQEMIRAAKRYYDGHHVKPLKIDPGEPDDNVIVNLCRTLIDDGVSWLFGDPETGVLTFEVDELDQSGDQGNWFDEFWEASGGLRLLKRMGKRGGVAGHAFLKLIEPEEDELYPRVVSLDPLVVTMRAADLDEDQIIAYKIEWKRIEKASPISNRTEEFIYRQLYANAGTAKEPFWVIAEYKASNRTKKKRWEVVTEPYGWPWQWCPVHDCPNIDSPWGIYGLSDLEDSAWLNDNLNFISSNTMRILKYHAHPRTIITGASVTDIVGSGINDLWTIPTAEAKVQNLEMQSDLGSSLAMLDFIRGAFWTIGRGMDVSIYKDKIGQMTNFALRVLALRALQKMGDKRINYGKLLRDVNTHAQEMVGFVDPMPTVINWPVPLPVDQKQELDMLAAETSLGITSKQTASEERGRNWEKERARLKQEKQETLSLGEYVMTQFDKGMEPGDEYDAE